MAIPTGWNAAAHDAWTAGRRGEAVGAAFAELNAATDPGPEKFLQPAYYLFILGDFAAGRTILESGLARHPDDVNLLDNTAVFQSRAGAHAEARRTLEHYLAVGGTGTNALDGLTAACHRTGDDEAAREWGRRAIEEKTRIAAAAAAPALALGQPRARGLKVISFSLWGDQPRYLRGALHNATRAHLVYPDFHCRFHVDRSVPADLLDALDGEGAELVIGEGHPPTRERLTRRFLVADDPHVALYLVRDCDSLVNAREAAAVGLWLAGDQPFHVMRDWWTHTDPMLAGMWGGRGGVLPPLAPLIAGYKSGLLETPSWDQWWLRDLVWPSIRTHALVHDRFFASEGAQPFPGLAPPGNLHVGQDEYAVRRAAQAEELAEFAASVPSLKL